MNETLIFVTPLLALLILAAAFGFSGCGVVLPHPQDPPPEEQKPPEKKKPWEQGVVTPPPTSVVGPLFPAPETYEDIVKAAPGFAAFWPLNETGGNIAYDVGPLNPATNGIYRTVTGAPAGSGLKLGDLGVLAHKETDYAPTFFGSAGYVEVQFAAQLNPAKMVPGFTIELWVKPNPAQGADTQVIVSSHRVVSATVQQGYEIALVKVAGQTNQQVRARVYNNTATPGQAAVVPLQGDPTEWRHIVMTYRFNAATGGSVSVYVRLAKSAGAFVEGPFNGTYEPVISTASTTLRFAAGHGVGQGLASFFAGQIDNVAFYNAALDQAEIDKHFKMF